MSGEGREGAGDWTQSFGQWFNPSCLCHKIPIKILVLKLGWASWLVNILMDPEGETSWFPGEETQKPCTGSPLRSCPLGLLLWLLLICIFCDKTFVVSIEISRVLWVILVNHQIWGDRGNPQIHSQLARNSGDLRNMRSICHLKQGQRGWALCPKPVESTPALGNSCRNCIAVLCTILSTDEKKRIGQNSTSLQDKYSQKNRKQEFLNLIKSISKKSTVNTIFHSERMNVFPQDWE